MTEYPQHQKAVQRIKDMMRNAGAIIRENSDERGEGGWKFAPVMTTRNAEPIEYTADIFAHLPNNQPLIIEIDGNKSGQGHFSDRAVNRDKFRDAYFTTYGIVTVRFTTPDALQITEAQLWEEIEYWTRQFRKALTAAQAKPLVA